MDSPALSWEEAEVTRLTEVGGWIPTGPPLPGSGCLPTHMPMRDSASRHMLPKLVFVGCREVKQGLNSLVWDGAKAEVVIVGELNSLLPECGEDTGETSHS